MPDQNDGYLTPEAQARYRLSRMQFAQMQAAGLRSSHAHRAFLSLRSETLQQIGRLALLKTRAGQSKGKALFSQEQLAEFASGSISACFGPEYKIFEGRRYPRIPNGDLLLMSRVVSIEGKRHDLQNPASIVTEYDVPVDAWFYPDEMKSLPPYSILMESALQPCGFLSAAMGTAFLQPGQDLYFRNLDGQAEVLEEVDLRGRTITNQARLLSTTISSGTIIQKCAFTLMCAGRPFFRGESIFGYFSKETMASQTGLDGGRQSALWQNPGVPMVELIRPGAAPRSRGSRFDLLDEAIAVPHGGISGRGYILAKSAIRSGDWFYGCHFHEDPVMPGSLGVEAILQALRLYAAMTTPGTSFQRPDFSHPLQPSVSWKYRGQILPTNRQLTLEVHLLRDETGENRRTITGDASLWIDGMRIYEVKGLGLRMAEAGV